MDALASTATKAAEMASRIPVNNPQSGHQVGAIMAFCDTILTIIPAGLMIAVWPIYIRWYHGMKMVTFTWDLACIKLISVIGLVVFEIMRFASWFGMQTNTLPFLTSTTAAASLLSTMASVTLGIAMFYDHFYSPQSTTFISLFLTVSVFAEALKAKYLPSFGRLDHLVTLTVGCMIAKAFLIVLLEIPKTLHSSTDANTKVSSGDRGGFWSRLWALGAISHGFQNHLSLNELGSIGSTMESRKLLEKVEGIWDAADQRDPYALFKTCLHAFSLPLFVAWLTCIGPPVVRFISVLVKKTVLEYLQNPEASSYTKYQLLGGFASVQIMAAISESIFAYSCTVLSLHLRGALTGLLLRKQIRLPSSEAETSNLSTLMTSDINSVTALIPEMCHVMTTIPDLTFRFYVLATMIGSAFITPFCIIIANI